jgi:hypothetical protein
VRSCRAEDHPLAGSQSVAGRRPAQPDLATATRAVWTRASDPQQGKEFRLFFAVYGRALQDPQQFSGFLDHVVADWISDLRDR